MSTRADYLAEVERARRTARSVRLIAALTFAGGWVVVVLAVLAMAVDALPWDQAEELLWVLGIGGIVSGVAMFATSWNLQIAASRFELDIASKLP